MDEVSPFEPTVLGAMWKYKWMVLLLAAIFMALGVLYSMVTPKSYQAVATLVVEDPRSTALFDVGAAQNPQRYVADQATILESTAVAERAVELQAGLGDARTVLSSLDVSWDSGSSRLQVIYEGVTRVEAGTGANAVIEAYAQVRREASSRELEAALDQLDESIGGVEAQLSSLQAQIEAELSADPARRALDQQLEEALARLVEVQEELPDASGTELELIRGDLDDISQQIQILQAIRALDHQSPLFTSLLDEQSRTIARKADLLQRQDELSVESRSASDGIVLSSPAIAAIEVGADPVRLAAIGLILGLLVATGLTYLRALRNRRFEDRTQPELVLEVPLLAEVPDFRAERMRRRELPVRSAPSSASAEAFRFIAAALEIESEERIGPGGAGSHAANPDARSVRSFIVVSPGLGDGKTVVAANTALASARQGKRVLAVDADFGYQRLSSLLVGDVKDQPGLTDMVEKNVPFREVVHKVDLDAGARLDLVSRGTVGVSAPDFFRSGGVRAFFEGVREEYDLVIIDSPPMLHVAYASLLVRYADRTITVVPHLGEVTQTEELTDRLDYLDTEVMGYVYNRAPLREDMIRGYGSLEDVLGKKR